LLPCKTPFLPSFVVAADLFVDTPRPAASTPIRLTFGVNILEPGGSARIREKEEWNWVFRFSTAL